jgi:hypothetical protein
MAFGQQKTAAEKTGEISGSPIKPQAGSPPSSKIKSSPALQNLVERAVTETVNKFAAKGFTRDNLGVTLIDLRDSNNLLQGDYRGEAKIYPASVVKLFYLVAAHRWLEDGRIKDSPELERGLRDMIVDSSNDATGYIVDVLSGVGGGAELPENEFKIWAKKRESVQRYFEQLGYQNINVKQKAFCEDAYGREQQFRGKDGINRNKLTTNATARLLSEIVLGKAVSAARSGQMMNLLKRDWEAKQSDSAKDPDNQAHGFTAIALSPGAKLWSKAGWTSTTRHDAAYIETPGGLKFVLVTFTENFANERDIIATIAKIVLEGLR